MQVHNQREPSVRNSAFSTRHTTLLTSVSVSPSRGVSPPQLATGRLKLRYCDSRPRLPPSDSTWMRVKGLLVQPLTVPVELPDERMSDCTPSKRAKSPVTSSVMSCLAFQFPRALRPRRFVH